MPKGMKPTVETVVTKISRTLGQSNNDGKSDGFVKALCNHVLLMQAGE